MRTLQKAVKLQPLILRKRRNGNCIFDGSQMNEELQREIWAFMDENRARALWWMRPDYYPQTSEQARDVLRRIAARPDRALFVRAMKLMNRLTN